MGRRDKAHGGSLKDRTIGMNYFLDDLYIF